MFQCGNGGIAMARGTHFSQRGLKSSEPLPEGVRQLSDGLSTLNSLLDQNLSEDELNEAFGELSFEDTLTEYAFDVDTGQGKKAEVTVQFSGDVFSPFDDVGEVLPNKATHWEVGFLVDGSATTTGSAGKAGTEVMNKVSQIFRREVNRLPENTVFSTAAQTGDGLGAFREAAYARVGFSFGNGQSSPTIAPSDASAFSSLRARREGRSSVTTGEGQFGKKVGGKVVPLDNEGFEFSASDLATHKGAIRSAIRAGIAQRRQAERAAN